MGIKKTVNYKGFNPEYMAITAVSFDEVVSDKIKVTLSLYKDRATKAANIQDRLPTKTVEMPLSDFLEIISQVKQLCYGYIATQEEYKDAEPVLEEGQ